MARGICGTLSPSVHRPRLRFLTRPSFELGCYSLSSRTQAFNHERNAIAISPCLSALDGSREPGEVHWLQGNALNDAYSNRSINTSLPPLRNCLDPLAFLPSCLCSSVWMETLCPASSHTAQALWKRSLSEVCQWAIAIRTPGRLRVSVG
jgi:hypothetical protein